MNIQTRSKSHRRRISGATYGSAILATGPIAYWPLDEASGSVARCLVNAAMNGTYEGPTLANAVGPDGASLHPLFDGSNDRVDIQSAALAAAFSGAAGTMALWAKVYNAAVWTDSAVRYAAALRVDSSNYVCNGRHSNDNTIFSNYRAGGTSEPEYNAGHSATGWIHLAITWDKAADAVIHYINGSQAGSADTGLKAWAGSLAICSLGGWSASEYLWYGWLAHPALWSTALSATQILALYTGIG